MKFKDKVVLVTGGSAGIGLAIVKMFLKEGASVVLASIDQDSADKCVEELKKEFTDSKIVGIAPKLADFNLMQEEVNKIVSTFGHLDILINNAGCSDETEFINYTEDIYDRVFNLNIKAMFSCSRAVVEVMSKQNSGVIINTSSVVGQFGSTKGMAYCSSKAAVNGFTLSLARELARYNIRVNAIAPGVTKTTMLEHVPEKYLEYAVQRIPLKRLGMPEDLASAVSFLASDEASYISGVILNVDGLGRF